MSSMKERLQTWDMSSDPAIRLERREFCAKVVDFVGVSRYIIHRDAEYVANNLHILAVSDFEWAQKMEAVVEDTTRLCSLGTENAATLLYCVHSASQAVRSALHAHTERTFYHALQAIPDPAERKKVEARLTSILVRN